MPEQDFEQPIHIVDTSLFTPIVLRELYILAMGEMKQLYEASMDRERRKHIEYKYPYINMANWSTQASTRTFGATIRAGRMLGFHVDSLSNAGQASSLFKGESIADTVSMLETQGYDIFAYRSESDTEINVAANTATRLSVISNGAGTKTHIIQAVLNYITVISKFNSIRGLTYVCVGDALYSRTMHDDIRLISQEPIKHVIFVAPKHLGPPDYIKQILRDRNISFSETDDLVEASRHADVLSVVRTQGEYHTQEHKKLDAELIKSGEIYKYIVTDDVMNALPHDAVIVHPLPRHEETAEIPCELHPRFDTDPRSLALKYQTMIGVITRLAIFASLVDRARYRISYPHNGLGKPLL